MSEKNQGPQYWIFKDDNGTIVSVAEHLVGVIKMSEDGTFTLHDSRPEKSGNYWVTEKIPVLGDILTLSSIWVSEGGV